MIGEVVSRETRLRSGQAALVRADCFAYCLISFVEPA